MPYAVIRGHFTSELTPFDHSKERDRSQHRRPTASTVHFRPSESGLRKLAMDFGLVPSARSVLEVRLEGIDALEVQYMGRFQAPHLARGARMRLLQLLGLGVPQAPRPASSADTKPSSATPKNAEGYLLARSVDRTGRLIAFAFAGNCELEDGAQLFVEARHIRSSVNSSLLCEGWVYPTCYDSLPSQLRADLVELGRRARGANLGLWPEALAQPARPLRITCGAALDSSVMFPKLFRRLVEFSVECVRGPFRLSEFGPWLRANPQRDEMLLMPNQEMGRLHDVFEVSGDTIRLKRNPEDFIVLKSSAAPLARSQLRGPDSPLRIIAAVVEPLDRDLDQKTVTLLNTTAQAIDLESFTLRDRVGRALELQGDLGPGEARRFRLGDLLLGADRLFGLSLLNGETVVDHVAFSNAEGRPPGASVVF